MTTRYLSRREFFKGLGALAALPAAGAIRSRFNPMGVSRTSQSLTDYKFMLLSDVHVSASNGNYATCKSKLLATAEKAKSLGCSFCVISGDLGYSSQASELSEFKTLWYSKTDIPFYACTGNHDAGNADDDWKTYVGLDKNASMVINGDLFLFMGIDRTSNGSYSIPSAPFTAALGDMDGTDWLKTQLDAHQDKRVFLVEHLPLHKEANDSDPSGVYLSGSSNWGVDQYYGFANNDTAKAQAQYIAQCMASHGNVILCHGHTHIFVDDLEKLKGTDSEGVARVHNMVSWEDGCADVHVPSLGWPRGRNADGTGTVTDVNMGQGYVVHVTPSSTTFTPYNFIESGAYTGTVLSDYEFSVAKV